MTADYAIKLLRPTPTNGPVFLAAKVVESTKDRATVEGTLTAGGKVCATCRGTFVAVRKAILPFIAGSNGAGMRA